MHKSNHGMKSCERLSSIPLVELLEDRHLLSAGQIDPGFGTGGLALLSDGSGKASTAVGFAKSEVAGGTTVLINAGDVWSFAVLNGDGQVDRSFGNDGFASQTFGVLPERAGPQYGAQAIAGDGNRLVAVGSDSTYSSTYSLPVLDIVNATTGATVFAAEQKIFPLDTYYDAVAIQSDHKIVIAGQTTDGENVSALLVRYLPSGQLDTTFGAGGIMKSRFVGTDNGFSSVAIQPDGKIVAAGYSNGGRNVDRVVVARYTSDGRLDRTLSTGGWVYAFPAPISTTGGLAVTAQGQIVVAGGGFDTAGNISQFVLRLRSDGSRDPSFAAGGTFRANAGFSNGEPVLIQADGKIIVSSFRLTANGQLDTTYGDNGFGDFDTRSTIALPDGRLLIATGTTEGGTVIPVISAILGDGAVIEGSAFNDANGNAKQDSGEATSLANVASVYLDQNNNGKQDPGEPAAELFADGSFAFYGLSPGSYVVRETLDAGVTQTTPTKNAGIGVTLANGQLKTGLVFGWR